MRAQLLGKVQSCWPSLRGVTYLDNRVFVLGRRSNGISVFEDKPPYSQVNEIEVKGLTWPRDMAGCQENRMLYVADNYCDNNKQYCIWRVDAREGTSTKYITSEFEPWKLSGNTRNLLVTPWGGKNLFVYGDNGILLKEVPLPRFANARYALETDRGTFITCHFSSQDNAKQRIRISEIDDSGNIIRSFDECDTQSSDPYLVVLDSHSQVMFIDYNNERISLLNNDLKFQRTLFKNIDVKSKCEVRRVCYVRQAGLLLVALAGGTVDIYKYA